MSKFKVVRGSAQIADISNTPAYIAASRRLAFEADGLLEAIDSIDPLYESDPEDPRDMAVERLREAISAWSELDWVRHPQDYMEFVLDHDDSPSEPPRAA